jgi:hypothetical protein
LEFHQLAAEQAGITVLQLLRVVRRIERKLEAVSWQGRPGRLVEGNILEDQAMDD